MDSLRRAQTNATFPGGRVATFFLAAAILMVVSAGTARAVEITVVNNSSTQITLTAQSYAGFSWCTVSAVNVSASRTEGLRLPYCAVKSITLANILSISHAHISCTLNSDVTPTSENHYDRPARSAYYWDDLLNNRGETYRVVCQDK